MLHTLSLCLEHCYLMPRLHAFHYKLRIYGLRIYYKIMIKWGSAILEGGDGVSLKYIKE